jgi:hypothetical protein
VCEDVPPESDAAPQRDRRLGQVGPISVDWLATLVAAVIVALAVADVLPKVPW